MSRWRLGYDSHMTTARARARPVRDRRPAVLADPVFRASGLSKVYRLGDVEVHALRAV
jgi:hypothetical protein